MLLITRHYYYRPYPSSRASFRSLPKLLNIGQKIQSHSNGGKAPPGACILSDPRLLRLRNLLIQSNPTSHNSHTHIHLRHTHLFPLSSLLLYSVSVLSTKSDSVCTRVHSFRRRLTTSTGLIIAINYDHRLPDLLPSPFHPSVPTSIIYRESLQWIRNDLMMCRLRRCRRVFSRRDARLRL